MSRAREAALAACAAQPGAELSRPFGPDTAVFKAEGRIFAIVSGGDGPERLTLKCEPDLAELLVRGNPEISPGYHMNKRHWITVDLSGGLAARTIRDLIEDSRDLVAS